MNPIVSRLVVVWLAILAATLGLLSPVAAHWAPTQSIRVIIPYAAGGTSDVIARVMAEPLRERLGQQLVIENRGGGATQIGTSMVAKSKPDGHTVLLVANTFTINPSLFSKLPYDSLTDLAPITYAGVTPHTMVVNNALPAATLKELLDLARKRPGELSYGSVGNGTSFHLGTEELKKLSGTSMIHVPYKGMGQVLTDVIAGNIQPALANTPNAAPLVREGKLRAVAVAHPTRVHQLPEVPTVAEQGFPGFSSNSAFMYLAPGGTPPEILDRLNAEFVAVLKLPAVRDVLTKQGVEVLGMTRAETADFIRSEIEKYAEVVKFSGAKVD
jgi:tripartite-type tricarboxylate transporter receptor subunit TctC